MRLRSALVLAPLLTLVACGDDEPAAVDRACPITEPRLLVAAPAGFTPSEDAWYPIQRFGDDLLFTFDRHDDPERVYWRLNRCTGALARYDALAPGLHGAFVVDTPAGRVLYGNDDAGRPRWIDRFDVDGADGHRPIPGLPDGVYTLPYPSVTQGVALFLWFASGGGSSYSNVAGLDAATNSVYSHSGDPEAPALELSTTHLRSRALADGTLLIHEESGEVSRVDPRTGDRVVLVGGARHLDFGADEGTFIWQAIGDDVAEPVYLHTLETGQNLQIAVNEFAAISWGREPSGESLGGWRYTGDGAAAAMVGPGGRLVAGVRVDTGASLVIPPHRSVQGAADGVFALRLDDPSDDVEAIWDPLSGALREWYRGPEREHYVVAVDGDVVDFVVRGADSRFVVDLWRVDLAAGTAPIRLAAEVLPYPDALGSSGYLVRGDPRELEGPRISGGTLIPFLFDLDVVDAAGETSRILDRITDYAPVADEGIFVVDAFGDEPGVWAQPLPIGQRSLRRSFAGGAEGGRRGALRSWERLGSVDPTLDPTLDPTIDPTIDATRLRLAAHPY